MIIYLHGFSSSHANDYEKMMQLRYIDPDVRFVNYSTLHPRHDMQHLLQEVHKLISQTDDKSPLICGVGLGGYWAERVGFLCGIKQVMLNPTLFPSETLQDKIDRPEEFDDIALKCVTNFREKNKGNALVLLSSLDEVVNANRSADALAPYYDIIWDDIETHEFNKFSQYILQIKAFKNS
ncbi:alpha/beta hydrolase YcfP [Actinobacillus porcinus]|uniref:Predicted esterase n=1 Tax=Actinobacillus porcinus TaxID=51048 RepID=A0ABY6THK3_9PAST|nr:alpha/beta hydrolase YcfP [Actinobacillus porcinus]MCI5764855.1 alpha/beta hydrolase YcfP [Actinobacillus porcinus]MDD7544208.1 alpha/beta hydrolase YcfP [Actinobacillus porcinus]MDY5422183.1 alpha/beta hydrolase YcfP [Actinobacillus porcinus]MDY5847269.1 alpha/beta hydrolase YcfP [Actinobacillus porcinus]MDY6215612.1 alpha/beta hydrolase YcfP [Actinobacillus porcinus]